MTTRRTTSTKRDRERAKQAKAEAKRARREARANAERDATPAADRDGSTDTQLLERLKDLHDAFDEGTLAFDDFDAQKSQLLERIAGHVSDPQT